VNGWSFVKKSKKYYEDCAQILTEHMLAAVKPVLLHGFSALDPLLTKVKDAVVDSTPKRRRHHKTFSRSKSDTKVIGSPDKNDDANSTATLENSAFTLAEGAAPVRQIPDLLMDDPTSSSVVGTKGDEDSITSKSTDTKQITQTHQEELRCVITVVRHGDRTPKQKLKVKMSEPLLLQYFHDHTDNCKKELKVKDKIPMTAFLETVRKMIAEKQEEEKYEKNNRCMKKNEIYHKMLHVRDVLERWKIGGLNRKLQMKPTKWDEYINTDGMKILKCTQLQLILKWGGNLTKLGEKQAINLGIRLRQDVYPDETGGGILRLHSTFRHDLKIITSDEGRVMKTAAAFAKGLLELEGPIPPILVSLVHKERGSHHMLDPSGNKEVKKELDACKVEVNKNLQKDFKMEHANPEMIEKIIGPPSLKSLHNALRQVGNPRKTLFTIHSVIKELLDQLDDMLGGITSDMENKNEGGEGLIGDEENETLSGIKLYKGETLLELTERWRLLYTKLYDEDEDEFDLSRVPDVHDNVRFDMLHNPHLGLTSTLEKLYTLAKLMADCVVPQEYGTSIEQKRGIGNKMCKALLEKLL
jgi:inositol hexakisphosphate/diphosphoinositol-pentakisphosphate kinase